MNAICEECNEPYKTIPSWYAKSKHHYCSRVCFFNATSEIRTKQILSVGVSTRFKPGDKPSKNRKMRAGEKHYAWKGEKVGYRGLHYWLRRIKGIPPECQWCGSEKSQWANIDGQYRRDPDDFISLCASCHKHYDLSLRANLGS